MNWELLAELLRKKISVQNRMLKNLLKYDDAVTSVGPNKPKLDEDAKRRKDKQEEIEFKAKVRGEENKCDSPADKLQEYLNEAPKKSKNVKDKDKPDSDKKDDDSMDKAVAKQEFEGQAEFKPGKYIFVSGDGDGIGAGVERKVLENDLRGIIEHSEVIGKGQAHIKKSFEAMGGKMIVHGGDDNLAVILGKDEHIAALEEIRLGYEEITKFTMTFGVGNIMRDAVQALVLGKLTGKNKMIFWHEGLREKLREVSKPQTQQEKMADHGLLSDDEGPKDEKSAKRSSD